jgi:hypothetical protein
MVRSTTHLLATGTNPFADAGRDALSNLSPMPFNTWRKQSFRLRPTLKNGEIAAHWESVGSLNFVVMPLKFGHSKDRPDSLSKFPNTL